MKPVGIYIHQPELERTVARVVDGDVEDQRNGRAELRVFVHATRVVRNVVLVTLLATIANFHHVPFGG